VPGVLRRGALVLSLVLSLCSAQAAPAIAALASLFQTTKCCKRLKAACCCRKRTAGPSWTAHSECLKQCSISLGAKAQDHSALPAPCGLRKSLPEGFTSIGRPVEGPAAAPSYLAFLYQMPPPVR
jgi:hypothetical protein